MGKGMKRFWAFFMCLIMVFSLMPSQNVDAATKTNISKCTIKLSKTSYSYTGSACKPTVTVKYGKKTLKNGTDFTVKYSNNTNPGTATVTITGKGKYTGSVKKTFKIKNGLTVSLSKTSYAYTGKVCKPSVTVKSGKTKLATKYYSVTYKNNTNAGTASVVVKGKGKYKGKNAYVTFKIAAKSITKTTISLSETSYIYSGSAFKPTTVVKDGSKTIKKDTDYSVKYANNINAGTATVTITGKGNYTGTCKKTFTIERRSLAGLAVIRLSETSYTYDGKECKPTVAVKLGTTTLKAGVDYTVSYSNNVEPGTATVTVSGRGNYAGSEKTQFEIKENADNPTNRKGVYPDTLSLQTEENPEKGYINKANVTFYWPSDEDVVCFTSVKNPTDPSNPRLNQYVSVNGDSENGVPIQNGSREFEIHANDATGDTEVYFQVGEEIFTCTVHVTKVQGDSDNPEEPEVKPGNCIEDRDYRVGEYTYGVLDEEFQQIEGDAVWTSSDESVAKIYDSITAGKKFISFNDGGTVTITAKKGDVIRSTTVKVNPPQDNIECETLDTNYESVIGNGTELSYGQAADSVIGMEGVEKASANKLNNPNGFDYCKVGDTYYCFVADVYNNRVLCYTSTVSVLDALSGGNLVADNTTADPNDKGSELATPAFVLGQTNFTSAAPGYSLDKMNWPMSVSTEMLANGKCRLYVSDVENDRILIFEDIEALTNGSPADYALEYFVSDDGSKKKIGWPWAVKSIDDHGITKLLVTDTSGYKLGIYTSPLDRSWSDDIKVDLTYEFDMWSTPRTICWTGSQLLIGDENIPWKGVTHSGFHVFDNIPTSQSDTWFGFFGETGYSEGTVINDKLYLVYAGGWNIFDKNEDGRFIENDNAVPDLELHSVRGWNYRVRSGDEGYFLNAGGTNCITYVKEDNVIVMPMLGRSAIYAWTDPENQLKALNTSAPDVFLGELKYKEDVEHVASDVQMHNPNVVSDGEHLVVHNDLDGLLYVYKNIPTSDGAIADYKYILANAAMDVELNSTAGRSTMVVTGNGNNTLYIWDDYKFDGALPNRILRNRIGGLNLPEMGALLQYMRYDGEYSYLSITENNDQNVYIYKGLVDDNSQYIVKVEGCGNYSFGHVSANTTHVAITVDGFECGRGGVLLLDKSKILEKATSDAPIRFNVDAEVDGAYHITKIHCGVTATEETDLEDNGTSDLCHYENGKSEVQTCINNELLLKTWTDSDGMNHTTHEFTKFEMASSCLLTEDGKLIVSDLGHCRVVVWNNVEAAIADQTKDYSNLTEDNPNVTIIGHGINVYDGEDINGHTKYDGHNVKDATFADTLRMPKSIAYDGHNLWIGEFKFSNRLLRFEMK